MTVETRKVTDIKCDQCKKKMQYSGDVARREMGLFVNEDGTIFYGENPIRPPERWYKFGPDTQNSVWPGCDIYPPANLCSLECARDWILAAIEERDNPKPVYVSHLVIGGDKDEEVLR